MRLVSARSRVRSSLEAHSHVRHGVVGNISACHADARGSIPRDGVYFSFFVYFILFCRLDAISAAMTRGIGAIGSVRASQARGTGIETQILQLIFFFFFFSPCALWSTNRELGRHGVLAQSEACVLSKDEVLGSKPRYST